ncbi:uncharacterized protein LOC119396389 isoform X1 [Rhipicephalus sanguineus]|uniref:Nuclear transcription factor Y subunit beta n=2 Tax=Rhipicephalus TaxID=426455 RepID=A0A131YT29_RHIAP|nr:uncharacterized protein LOC119396389 isoform X1 [Rhipicephalus sanguineus]XP_037519518.1 uncharacterized protein LOC119396389 isoform X1 [Rhipicephalus sanguineus]
MENGDNDGGNITDSFLSESGQYIVHAEGSLSGTEGEDGLGIAGDGSDEGDSQKDTEPLREQDRFLPIANVARIMKNAIPKSGKIAKDAKECVQECVSEFVSFITSEASDRCHQEKRKTINGEDILFAMSTLGFDNYIEPLKLYLQKYREVAMKGEKNLGTASASETSLEELADDTFPNILAQEPTTQQNVIFTTFPGNQDLTF